MTDEKNLGTIETRRGYFDGERHSWPDHEKTMTITRSLVRLNECISSRYADSGEVRFEKGERIRIFELVSEVVFTQTVPED